MIVQRAYRPSNRPERGSGVPSIWASRSTGSFADSPTRLAWARSRTDAQRLWTGLSDGRLHGRDQGQARVGRPRLRHSATRFPEPWSEGAGYSRVRRRRRHGCCWNAPTTRNPANPELRELRVRGPELFGDGPWRSRPMIFFFFQAGGTGSRHARGTEVVESPGGMARWSGPLRGHKGRRNPREGPRVLTAGETGLPKAVCYHGRAAARGPVFCRVPTNRAEGAVFMRGNWTKQRTDKIEVEGEITERFPGTMSRVKLGGRTATRCFGERSREDAKSTTFRQSSRRTRGS